MDDYTKHPLWAFSQNHPESPDVLHEEPLNGWLFDDAFDGQSLRFQDRMILCMDDICRERAKNENYDIHPKDIVRISKAWSLNAVDHVMILEDVLMFLDIHDDVSFFLRVEEGE